MVVEDERVRVAVSWSDHDAKSTLRFATRVAKSWVMTSKLDLKPMTCASACHLTWSDHDANLTLSFATRVAKSWVMTSKLESKQ